ncbi:recombination regulator RecX [Streptomyces spinoverrucosus]|uniref:recombination regulator RecX n=1 Tax=Streptomyces spinoverrucosus TaxID=284043 RepID=UPI0018C3F402|nr:recombination regulator RecX [Streptomyces spinoverrucosus]MBG0852059.1 recombination regulator RecX [Streptomyces spinoverrucosus]
MTRRTEWAEYAYPGIPREPDPGSADEGGFAGAGRGEGWPDGGSSAGVGHGDGWLPDGVSSARAGHGDDWLPDGGSSAGIGRGDGRPDGGSRAGAGASGGGRPRGGRGEAGSRRARGRRRRGFAEPSAEDGGTSSLSRAEQEESPGDPAERARAICLRLLTGTPRTRKQLADALRKREIPDDVAEEVLSRFEEVGLINDSAFADAWVESRHHGRGLARRALAQELRTKGVDSTLIDAAVAQLDSEQEETTARELVARKLRSTRGLERDKRLRRLAGMLARKGYPEGMALRVVRQALEEEGEDTEFLGEEGF